MQCTQRPSPRVNIDDIQNKNAPSVSSRRSPFYCIKTKMRLGSCSRANGCGDVIPQSLNLTLSFEVGSYTSPVTEHLERKYTGTITELVT